MLRKNLNLALLLAILFLFGCSNEKTSLKNRIVDLETREAAMSPEDRKALNQLYEEYALKYPKDSVSEIYLANAIVFNNLIGNARHTLELGATFTERYADQTNARDVNISLGQASLKLGAVNDAITYFGLANELQQLENSYLIQLGEAYERSAQLDSSDGRQSKLIRAANIRTETGYLLMADSMFKQFVKTYPSSEYAPYAIARRAEIMESMGNLEAARSRMEELIASYPESNFASDARIMIDRGMIGKTDEEKYEISRAFNR